MELLDRSDELRATGRLLAAARAAAGGALVLRGEHGVGLTTLLENAIASAPDMRVLLVTGIDVETRLPYAGLQRLLAPLATRTAQLPAAQRLALEQVLGLELPSADGASRSSSSPLVVGLAVLALLADAARERPVLCVVDDAERLDQQTALVLAVAARRLRDERIAVLVALHEPVEGRNPFASLDELRVAGLPEAEARALLDSVLGSRLDPVARERVLVATGGNPLAIVELPPDTPPEVGLPFAEPLPLGPRLLAHFAQRLGGLSVAARKVLLLAATLQGAGAELFWDAAELLGVGPEAADEAVAAGVLVVGRRVEPASPLLGAGAYGLAAPADRRLVHAAVAEAAASVGDADVAAWHRGAAAVAPSEELARDLVAAAARARARGDAVTAARQLERGAELTSDVPVRVERLLEAAEERVADRAPRRASALVAEAAALPLTELERARVAKLRAALGQGSDAATMLLRAATEIARIDARQGRTALLEALEAAIYSARLGSGGPVLEAARVARELGEPGPDADAEELLLHGLALRFTDGYAAAAPTLRLAVAALRTAPDLRWLALGTLSALELWDDEGLTALVARRAGQPEQAPLSSTSVALSYVTGLGHVVAGRFSKAAAHYRETRALGETVGDQLLAGIADAGSLLVAAWTGPVDEARRLIEQHGREALTDESGRYYAFTRYALAVLENAAAEYEAALLAAQDAVASRGLYLSSFALVELVEAAARAGRHETAVEGLAELAGRARASGTDWALGMLARSRALVADGPEADALHREAIERLGRTAAMPQLARAYLLHGEWLRRRRRRRDARGQLRRAHGMFVAMSAGTFEERALVELEATGERRSRPEGAREREALTAQEQQVARLAAEGASNPEIGARLFISARTVEYHLHKIYRKLGVSSRVQLAAVLGTREPTDPAP